MRILENRLRSTEPQKMYKEQLIDYVLRFQDKESGMIQYSNMADDLRRFDYDLETNKGFVRGNYS